MRWRVGTVLVVDCYVEGDGAANFRRLLGDTRVAVWRAISAPCPTDLSVYTAIMISGSAACLTSPEPWMKALNSLILKASAAKVPMLGVCFGHQVIAHTLFGPTAVRSSATPEIGWVDIELSGDDPLFRGMGEGFNTFESHFDEVLERPGMIVLARSKRCAVQAYRVKGENIWGIQFHSEMTVEEAVELAERRIAGRPEFGFDIEQILAQAKDSTTIGTQIMNNFIRAR